MSSATHQGSDSLSELPEKAHVERRPSSSQGTLLTRPCLATQLLGTFKGAASVIFCATTAGSDSDDAGSLEILQHHSIALHEVLGRGMFGKVYKGAGCAAAKAGACTR